MLRTLRDATDATDATFPAGALKPMSARVETSVMPTSGVKSISMSRIRVGIRRGLTRLVTKALVVLSQAGEAPLKIWSRWKPGIKSSLFCDAACGAMAAKDEVANCYSAAIRCH
jgi:hypothetical protein